MTLVDPERGHAAEAVSNDVELAKFAGKFVSKELRQGNVPAPAVIETEQRSVIGVTTYVLLTVLRDKGVELHVDEIVNGLRSVDFGQIKAELEGEQ